MGQLLLTILNMSFTASYVIMFVIIIRLLLRKAPKSISYALWSIAGFRLVIPFSFESVISLIPRKINISPIPHNIIYQERPRINSGIEVIDSAVNRLLPLATAQASANPLQIAVELGAYVWAIGIIALLFYSIVSVLILKTKLKSAKLLEDNIYQVEYLKTPFVLGIIKPKIYLPYGINDEEKDYILLHEQIHIMRKDYIIKPLAFLILTIHWFNPLVWISFILMSKDMELSCDERVLRQMDGENKKSYANTLLSLATKKQILNGGPLAFGEGSVKGRIKNVLNYKKPKFWLVVILIILLIRVGIGLISNPYSAMEKASYEESLWAGRTEYIGDNSAVGNLISLLPIPEGLQYDHLKLHTKERPYGVEIIYKESSEASNSIDVEDNKLLSLLESNSVILLALIDNADQIMSRIINTEDDFLYVINREWADDLVGSDVRDYAKSTEKLGELIALVNSRQFSDNKSRSENNFQGNNMESVLPESYILIEAGKWPKTTYTSNIPGPNSGTVVNGWIDTDREYCYIEMERKVSYYEKT